MSEPIGASSGNRAPVIVEARLYHYRVPFAPGHKGADAREGVIVELTTDAGTTGVGESVPPFAPRADMTSFVLGVDEAANWALRKPPTTVSHRGLPEIWTREGAGVEVAAWDLVARGREEPLWRFLALKPYPEAVKVNPLTCPFEVSGPRATSAAAEGVLFLEPLALGGLGPTLRASAAARADRRTVSVRGSTDAAVGRVLVLVTAAVLGCRGYLRGAVSAALSAHNCLESALVDVTPVVVDGWAPLWSEPGLGVHLNRDVLERYTLREWSVSA